MRAVACHHLFGQARQRADDPAGAGAQRHRPQPRLLAVSMSVNTPAGERLAVLEARLATLEQDVHGMRLKVDAMHDVLMQAKGVRWAIIAVAGFAGFLAGVVAKLMPLIGR
jgi:hypothetical protein